MAAGPYFPSIDQFPPGYAEENNSRPLLETCIAFLVLDTTFMILLYTSRFLCNDKKHSSEQRANWSMISLMTGTYIVCISKITLGFLAIHVGGAGRHTATLDYATITTALQINTALQLICPLTTSLSKMSILCLLHTIFGRTSERTRLVIRITFVLCLITLLVQVIIPFANCRPFSASWTLGQQSQCAISGLALWKYLSIPNVIGTLVVVAIPLPALYKLRVSAATKLGLAVVLSVCVCGVVAAIMRFVSFVRVMSFDDFSYEQIDPLRWTIAESGIYMVAGVLPTLRPLMKKLFGNTTFERILTGRFRSSGSGKSGVSDVSWGHKRGSVMGRGDVDEVALVKKEKKLSALSTEETVVGFEDEEKIKL
ncbi:hypothetical protein DPSP01_002767 [Paraphaeosphaeria sporulosa]|uniref:Rhodopsin domain-containing protein n=1 Tax=Paraphaeosphaeria sporulosa TaxID=1460663 RepID=A0A177CFI4_9PLEO|nr:uncharacterized protein CC84DRAFT_1217600 [Paraphaeosphaeria sporulosa]OAG06373.1 hypothetical protein CC84DRAFT_1217600 [Paraphaeosphaeria sporulosa]